MNPMIFRHSDNFLAFLVGSVTGGQGFEDIGDRHDARLHRHFVPLQSPGIARAIHFLVVPAGILGHVLQALGKRQAIRAF